jgi:hypothetical protein
MKSLSARQHKRSSIELGFSMATTAQSHTTENTSWSMNVHHVDSRLAAVAAHTRTALCSPPISGQTERLCSHRRLVAHTESAKSSPGAQSQRERGGTGGCFSSIRDASTAAQDHPVGGATGRMLELHMSAATTASESSMARAGGGGGVRPARPAHVTR